VRPIASLKVEVDYSTEFVFQGFTVGVTGVESGKGHKHSVPPEIIMTFIYEDFRAFAGYQELTSN